MGKNVCRDVGRVALQPLIGLCGERGDHSGEKTGLLNVSSSPKYNSGNATYKNKEIVQVFLPVVDARVVCSDHVFQDLCPVVLRPSL